MEKNVTAIILAAGIGSRMASKITKQKMMINGKSLLWHSVNSFVKCSEIDSIIVVCREDEFEWVKEETKNFSKQISVVVGGKTRAESARLGFNAISQDTNFIAIHDAARCLITSENIEKVVLAAYESNAATAATAITDTLKLTDGGVIKSTVPRNNMFSAQTPQVFSKQIYAQALNLAYSFDEITDDNMLVERLGKDITVVDTGRENLKVTTVEDLDYAEFIFRRRGDMNEMRIGHGYDVHRLVEGRKFILGGVEIPHDKGLLGHSDADVLIHAIVDSLLGACGMGDIGKHFPDSSSEFKDISSLILLSRVASIIADEGYSIVNIDATVVLQKPKVAGYIDQMISNVAQTLNVEINRINIKATTEEQLGFTGRQEGVSAHSVAMVKK